METVTMYLRVAGNSGDIRDCILQVNLSGIVNHSWIFPNGNPAAVFQSDVDYTDVG